MNPLDARRRLLGRNVYKKTVEGNPAIAQGSLARRYPGIEMQGWTEQAQYEGNQLFDASSVVDGIISNGEVVENGSFVTSDFISVIAGNVYSRSATGASGNFFYNADKTYLQNVTGTVNIEAPEGAVYVRFCINKNDFDIQDIILNEGSTVIPYEPYTGGQPSPNPEYPQPITSAGKYDEDTQKWEYEVEAGCGQLLNLKEKVVDLYGITCVSNGDTITINGEKTNGDGGRLYYITSVFVLQPGTYTFVYEIYNDINFTISGVFITKSSANEILGKSFTLNESTEVYIGINILEGRQANDVAIRCMLNAGSTAFPYTPYRTPQTVTLTSDRPLTKWDRLEKRNGQWGWVYKSMEITLDGSEKWTSYDAYSGFYSSNILPFYDNRRDGYSENAFVGVYGIYSDERFAIWLGVRNSILYVVYVPQYDADLPDHGLQNWKDWLSENPIKIITYADDETFVPLSESEQEAMNALYTFRPTTVLSNDCECEMTLTYKTKKSLEVIA